MCHTREANEKKGRRAFESQVLTVADGGDDNERLDASVLDAQSSLPFLYAAVVDATDDEGHIIITTT